MEKCVTRYLGSGFSQNRGVASVLDVGGSTVNGSYSNLFPAPQFRYLAADLEAGPGVSIVMDDPYVIPLETDSVDVVVSGQMLEHCEFFWLSFTEMVRVVRADGIVILIAPSSGPIHNYPVDCYRFYPDAYRALAKYADCEILDVWHDERGPWNDLVGVFAPTGSGHVRIDASACSPSQLPGATPVEPHIRSADDVEVTAGTGDYLDILRQCHQGLEPREYVEIGVRHGHSLQLAAVPALGIDPFPELTVPLEPTARVVETTSDNFFDSSSELDGISPDLAFIDGMHLAEFALRDFMNLERIMTPTGLVVIDDVLPNHQRQADRKRSTQVWTGDVWKLVAILRQHRPDLSLIEVDVRPTGLLMIAGLDPRNRALWEKYNPIVRSFVTDHDGTVPANVLERADAVAGDDAIVGRVVQELRNLREKGAAAPEVRAALDHLVPTPVRQG